ncbi:transmembrane protein 107 isoform X2 [Lagopus muta]|nr:transmembrane protein 107 isoform X2 [Lagopus muta]XP_048789092.1 transmembrane protein 107 isoform X2 [Lagopus muta]
MAPRRILVLARFLTMMAHLVALLIAVMAREPYVRASLPLEFSQEEYSNADTLLLCVVGSALGLLAVELGGFFSGVSMFHPGQGLLSTLLHAGAALILGLSLLEEWDLSAFTFTLCVFSVPPAAIELLLLLMAMHLKRKLL